MNPLALRHRQVGPWGMNTYALICPHTGESVLFDPGDDADILEEMLAGSQPIAILLTHTHEDHVGALEEMRARLGGVPVMVHSGPHAGNFDPRADRHLADGDTVQVGKHQLRVRHAPGHCPDQMCFVLADDALAGEHRVIVGDTIFAGGPGKTWSPEGFAQTRQTLREVVLPWPDTTICYPGHGPSFRLGDLRAQVEAFLAKDFYNFYGDATWDM
jgi:hydroxyacylglutathione hydrolase